jgi:hypothetical protein
MMPKIEDSYQLSESENITDPAKLLSRLKLKKC